MKIKKLINWLPKVGYYINSSSVKQDGAPQSSSAAPVVIKIEAYATPDETGDTPVYGTISSSYISKIKELYENSNIAEQGENIPNVLLAVYQQITDDNFICLTATPNVIMASNHDDVIKVDSIAFPVMLSGELCYISIGCTPIDYDIWDVIVIDDIKTGQMVGIITVVEDE